MPETLLESSAVARELLVSAATVAALARAGVLPTAATVERQGRVLRLFRHADVEALAARRREARERATAGA